MLFLLRTSAIRVQALMAFGLASVSIKKMRSRDPELNASWGTICTPTRMMATDGKYYKAQAAPMEGIFRIIQSIPSKKAEPFKRWMAEVAAQRLEQMADPELSINQAIADFPSYRFVRLNSLEIS